MDERLVEILRQLGDYTLTKIEENQTDGFGLDYSECRKIVHLHYRGVTIDINEDGELYINAKMNYNIGERGTALFRRKKRAALENSLRTYEQWVDEAKAKLEEFNSKEE